jgi:hypothetical protein
MACSTSRPRTRRQTLYFLPYAEPSLDGLLDAFDDDKVPAGYSLDFPDLGGVRPAQRRIEQGSWGYRAGRRSSAGAPARDPGMPHLCPRITALT